MKLLGTIVLLLLIGTSSSFASMDMDSKRNEVGVSGSTDCLSNVDKGYSVEDGDQMNSIGNAVNSASKDTKDSVSEEV